MSLKFDVSNVDVEDFLEALEVENVQLATEDEYKFSCPFSGHSHGDQNPSAYMNIETTAWMCHGCHRKGNAVTFLAELETITTLLATRFLQERYGGVSSDPDAYSARVELERLWDKNEKLRAEQQTADEPIPEAMAENYSIDWKAVIAALEQDDPGNIPEWGEYILNRGFLASTLTEWDIGYDDESDRITIPVRDVAGHLVGFKARAWRQSHKPKYLVLKPRWPTDRNVVAERYHVALNVFGLYRAIEAGETHLIVVEGELNAIALWQLGYRNVVALNGSNFSDRHAFLLRNYADKVTVWMDPNDAGYDGILKVVNALSDYMPVDVVPDCEYDAADFLAQDGIMCDAKDSVRELLDNAESALKIMLQAGV